MSREHFTTRAENGWDFKMLPVQLRAIRMDMGLNMNAMASMLERETGARISRNKYRAWERPKSKGEWMYVPRYAAEAAEKLYASFWDFVTTLVSMYDGESPLVMIHRNDMFSEAGLPLPEGISVDNYNQAVGKAWGIIMDQGYVAELTYFSTDPEDKNHPEGPSGPHPGPRGKEKIHPKDPEIVGGSPLPGPRQPRSFVTWGKATGKDEHE